MRRTAMASVAAVVVALYVAGLGAAGPASPGAERVEAAQALRRRPAPRPRRTARPTATPVSTPTPAASPSASPTPGPGHEAGVCGGVPCGPSGAFTASSFPTTAGVDFAAFPANPSRTYRPAAGGREWFVSPGGSDAADGSRTAPLASPGRAIELARAGDVVWLADGAYAVGAADDFIGLRLDRGVVLAAERIGGATLVPSGPGIRYGIRAEADDLVVDGLVVRDFAAYGIEYGRLASPQRRLVLRHLVVEGGEAAIAGAYREGGATPTPIVEGMLVYDVRIRQTGAERQGFDCGQGPCDDVRLEALRIELARGGSSSGSDAIACERGDNIVIFNVEITGASADGIDVKGTRVAIANAWVHDIQRNGIKLWRGGDVINALVHDTGADASVVFDMGATYRIVNSVVARHAVGADAYAGTVAYDNPGQAGRLEVVNSIFWENAGALWVSRDFALDVRDSIFSGAGNGREVEWGDVIVGEQADGFDALERAGGGTRNRIVDPGFARDWRLGASSPARDAGRVPDALPSFDLHGGPRVEGAAVDLGPIEG